MLFFCQATDPLRSIVCKYPLSTSSVIANMRMERIWMRSSRSMLDETSSDELLWYLLTNSLNFESS